MAKKKKATRKKISTAPRKKENQTLIFLLLGAVGLILLLVVLIANTNKTKQTDSQNLIQEEIVTDSFEDFEYTVAPEWTVTLDEKKVNPNIVFEDKANERKITVIKNYVGGLAGFKHIEIKEAELNGQKVEKSYNTEDSPTPSTVSMFINYGEKPNKYLIVASWNISDTDAEAAVDQVLSSFKF